MFILLRLLLAHFIADFPLQFNKIYELKNKSLVGGIPHALIVAICFIACSWPYLGIPGIWVFIYFFSFLHLFQDSTKIKLGSRKYSIWLYLLDQLFHIVTISTILVTKLKYLTPPQENGNLFITLYNNNLFVVFLIVFIAATYNGAFLIRNFKLSFLDRNCSYAYSGFEKWFGMLESIDSCGICGRWLLLCAPAPHPHSEALCRLRGQKTQLGPEMFFILPGDLFKLGNRRLMRPHPLYSDEKILLSPYRDLQREKGGNKQ
jgi:hypothetical protein